MSKIALSGNASGTGTLSIAAPDTNTDRTLTLPDNSGTLLSNASTFAGTGPAFSAYASASQSISNITFTKIQINTENFDTNSNFDPTTNYRFTPTVAGYYQINGCVNGASSSVIRAVRAYIYKNGLLFKLGNFSDIGSGATAAGSMSGSVHDLIYMNGTTDYLELYTWIQTNSGTLTAGGGDSLTYFSGFLARAA
jgi:hypothetical protein